MADTGKLKKIAGMIEIGYPDKAPTITGKTN